MKSHKEPSERPQTVIRDGRNITYILEEMIKDLNKNLDLSFSEQKLLLSYNEYQLLENITDQFKSIVKEWVIDKNRIIHMNVIEIDEEIGFRI